MFLVAWQADADGDGFSEVWARWVPEPGGFSSPGPAFQVSPSDGRSHFEPAVGVGPDDGGVISWTKQAGEISSVWARTIPFSAPPTAPAVAICGIRSSSSCFGSKVAANLDNQFSIGWVQHNFTTEEEAVMYQTFADVDLNIATSPQQVNSSVGGLYWLVNLHVDATGACDHRIRKPAGRDQRRYLPAGVRRVRRQGGQRKSDHPALCGAVRREALG